MPEPPPTFDEILAYLRQHGSTYSRESIEGQLRHAGADLATIDRAFLAWEDEILAADSADSAASPPRRALASPRRPLAWPWSLALAAVYAAGVVLWIQAGLIRRDPAMFDQARSLFPAFWLGELILGIVLIRLSPRLSRILLLAVLWEFLLALAALLLVLGFCAWLFVQISHGSH